MPSIIKLLPDSVANQIAAGEVIQRPASAVKELLENAVDADATEILLIIKEAGKNLIHVTDNGSGMSAMDVRMCFERHATSKIKKAEDLFSIKTLGFRGEAMASIAAIAQVEARTRQKDDELGTCLKIEGSKVISQEPCQSKAGTSILVKNLFFNVPARRNFLKSNNAETRHIVEEFIRVSLVNPQLAFTFYNHDKIVFKLDKGSFKSRIVSIFGKNYDQRLLPVEQKTDLISISGFIIKPEFSKKTRGEQYFFVNGRFIKHPYLNHAVSNAFNELIPGDSFPGYFINIEVEPSDIDVNIHPTKTEVNFKDSKYVYAVLHAAVKQSIGKYNLTPMLDFDVDPVVESAFQNPGTGITSPPQININPDFNPFNKDNVNKPDLPSSFHTKLSGQDPSFILQGIKNTGIDERENEDILSSQAPLAFFQVHKKFILCNVRSGLMLIHQQRAHQRILYEKFLKQLKGSNPGSQQQLFPYTISFSKEEISILTDLSEELNKLGFNFHFNNDSSITVDGIPADLNDNDIKTSLEHIIESFKNQHSEMGIEKPVRIARTLASQLSLKTGKVLTNEEMSDLFDRLFACSIPDTAPDGSKIIGIIAMNNLESFLQ